jgi:hypothetical protein
LNGIRTRRVHERSLVKAINLKTKKSKVIKASLKNLEENQSSSDEVNDFVIENEIFPKIQSPSCKNIKIVNIGSTQKKMKTKPEETPLISKRNNSIKSQRYLKSSLDPFTTRKILESFPSLESISDNKKLSEIKLKLSLSKTKRETKEIKPKKEKLPALKPGFYNNLS